MSDEPTDTNGTWMPPTPDTEGAAAAAAAAAAGPLPTDRPEALIGGAFAGGFLAAMILKRIGRR